MLLIKGLVIVIVSLFYVGLMGLCREERTAKPYL